MSTDSPQAGKRKTAITPMLSVRNGKKAVEFYQKAFEAEVLLCVESEEGEVIAQLSVDGAVFWLSDESPEHANFSPESLGGGTVRIVLIVEDPDTAFERAVAAGATVVCSIRDEHAWRIGRVLDPFGHHWEIGKPLAEGE